MSKRIDLRQLIRDIPDFPKKDIVFKDITPLLKDREGFNQAVEEIAYRYKDERIDLIVGIEARGFILAGALGYRLKTGMIPVRKKNKLPYQTNKITYQLEYGTDTLEIHKDAIGPGDKVLIVDDLLATGGTVEAVIKLVEDMGGRIVEIAFFIELTFLKGRERLKNYPMFSLIKF